MGDKVVAVKLRFGELRVGSCNARIGDCNVYRGVKAYLYFLLDLSGVARARVGLILRRSDRREDSHND